MHFFKTSVLISVLYLFFFFNILMGRSEHGIVLFVNTPNDMKPLFDITHIFVEFKRFVKYFPNSDYIGETL